MRCGQLRMFSGLWCTVAGFTGHSSGDSTPGCLIHSSEFKLTALWRSRETSPAICLGAASPLLPSTHLSFPHWVFVSSSCPWKRRGVRRGWGNRGCFQRHLQMGQRAKGAGAKDRLMLCASMLERPREGELGGGGGG